mgnify:CR=1 FL=1
MNGVEASYPELGYLFHSYQQENHKELKEV